jgi:hypothetical protein
MFGLGNSAVSRRAGIFKTKLQENSSLQSKFSQLKSIIDNRDVAPEFFHDTEVAGRTLGPSLKKIKPWSASVAQAASADARASRG